MKLSVINTLLLVAILGYLIIDGVSEGNNKSSQAYVVTGELFSEFDYAKELDSEYMEIKKSKENQLNQIKSKIISMEEAMIKSEYTNEDYMIYQKELSNFQSLTMNSKQELDELNNSFSAQIWSKLNSYTQKFGEEKGLDVIYGATGSGNLMYANESMNLTAELIEYCNSEYSGR